MYTDEDLYAAVKVGVLEERAVDAFRRFMEESGNTNTVDEENFRLISGFNDIFVSIAALLLLISAAWLGSKFEPAVGLWVAAALAWLLSILFVTKRRLALPAILFLFTFVGSVMGGTVLTLVALDVDSKRMVLIAPALGIVAAWLHWLKFRVPITVAAGVGSFLIFLIVVLAAYVPGSGRYGVAILAAFGVFTFLVAMYWDAQDVERKTRKSDVAFWLHLMAAPLIVHPVFISLKVFQGESSLLSACLIIAVYLVLGVISIAIDRRALMVSALIYVIYAFSELFKMYGMVSEGFAVTGILIGSMLLLLSALWGRTRAVLLRHLSPPVKRFLPRVRSLA